MKLNYEIRPDDYSKVVYGDSVTSETPVLLKYMYNDNIVIDKIRNLTSYTYSSWKPYVGFKMFDLFSKKEYIDCHMMAYTHKGWSNIKKVIRHKTPKTIYRVYTNVGMVEVTKDHSLIDHLGKMIKPENIKIMKTKLLFDDSFAYNIQHKKQFYGHINRFKTQLEAMECYCYYKSKDQNLSVEYEDGFYTIMSYHNIEHEKGVVTKIEKITNYQNYVYDIETENGTFQAGIGSIIVKNTDSCMIELKTKSFDRFKILNETYKHSSVLDEEIKSEIENLKTKVLEESFEVGKKLAKEITKNLFKAPIELEFEKIYHPFIILTKKRYIGNYYGKSPYKIDKVEKKGIVLSRRDNPDIVKKIYEGIINPLLKDGSRGVNEAITFLKQRLQELKDNKTDLNDLVITKTLAKGYGKEHIKKIKDKEYLCEGCDLCKEGVIFGPSDYKQLNSPHVALAMKKRRRDRGSAPVINDRLSYVFIKLPDPKAKLYERAEELEVVREKKLHIDYLYYMQNQLKNPICEVLNLVMENPSDIFEEFTKDMIEKPKKKVDKNQPTILKWIGSSTKK